MRRTLLALSALLAAGAGPATQPTTEPTHDRDPWVFRCVLDDNARMLVVSLGHHVWAAYDTQHATLAKLWVGDVDFTGAVFDTKHGPQPKARGVMLIDQPMEILQAPSGSPFPANDLANSYVGFRLEDGEAAVGFRFGATNVSDKLTVTGIDADAHTVTVRRTITIDGTPPANGPVGRVVIGKAPRTKSIRVDKIVASDGHNNDSSAPAPDTAQPPLAVTAPGHVVIEMTFDTDPQSQGQSH